MGKTITKTKLLLVEGKDETLLFEELLADLGLVSIQVRPVGGVTKFRSHVKALTFASGFAQVTSIGIVRDADTNPGGAFDSVCGALRDANLPQPTAPLQSIGDAPQVTVMILPDSKTPGMLEDLCLESVKEDPAMPCVDEYFRCLKARLKDLPGNPAKAQVRAFLASMEWLGEAHFNHIQKRLGEYLPDLPEAPSVAQTHVFLASRYKPNLDLGVAAQAGYWLFNHPAFAQLKQFLRML